jgi:ribosomal protein L24
MSIFTTRPGSDSSDSLLEAVNKAAGNVKPSKPVARPQKGSFVMPTVGPHKGMRHKVTDIHEDGAMTVVPWDIHPSQIKYRMGAAKATADQVEPIDEAAPTGDAKKVMHAGYSNWTFEMDKGDKTKVIHGDHKGTRGEVVEKHNGGESYTVKHTDGTTKRHHISTLTPMNEEIKGWKNAGADIAKFRSAASNAAKPAKLVKLKKDGTESKMHDATSHYGSEEEATKKHHYLRELNPKSNMKHNLYINGKLHKTLHEDVETISELSKATLGRYAKAAGTEAVDHMGHAARTHTAADNALRSGDKEGHKLYRKMATFHGTKSVKRQFGQRKAIDKLVKEDNSRNLLVRAK